MHAQLHMRLKYPAMTKVCSQALQKVREGRGMKDEFLDDRRKRVGIVQT